MPDAAVLQLRRGLIHTGAVIQDGQFHIVRAFRGRHVGFHAERVGRDGFIPHLVALHGHAAIVHDAFFVPHLQTTTPILTSLPISFSGIFSTFVTNVFLFSLNKEPALDAAPLA